MDKKNKLQKLRVPNSAQAPGIDPEDSYGKNATNEEVEKGESTQVTRLIYDEYDEEWWTKMVNNERYIPILFVSN